MKVLQFDDYADLAYFMMEMATEENKCIIIVTHSENVCQCADVIYELQPKTKIAI